MISIDDSQLKHVEAVLQHIPKAMPRVIARSINRASVAAKTAALKKISNEYTIKRKRVAETFSLTKATVNNLSAFVTSKGRPNALTYFKTSPGKLPKGRPKNPVFVRVKQSGGGPIKGAFLAKTKSGHLGVFHRNGVFGRNGNEKLEEIEQNYGPSTPQMLENKTVSAFIENRAREILNKQLDHEVDVMLRGVVK